jgi:YVTN family beta-propeller protein
VNPAGTKVYVTNSNDNTVSVIDTSTNAVTVTLNVVPAPRGVAVDPGGTKVYVILNGGDCDYHITGFFNGGTVSVIDTSTNAVTATVCVAPEPYGIAVNPAGTKVYVTNSNDNTVSVIDTSTNKVTATVSVGSGPYGVAVNPAGTKVYVTNYGGHTVSVIDTSTNAVTATIEVGSHPTSMGMFIVGPLISVSPTSQDFGSVFAGSSSVAQTFTVSNTGTGNLNITSLSISGTDASQFTVQNDTCSNQILGPNKTCTVQAIFSPQSSGSKTATLIIPSNDPDNATVSLSLSGTAVNAPSGSGGGGGCFIATAAYGSYLDPHVQILREFRDRYLLTSAMGRGLVCFYSRTSPPIGHWIGRHEPVRTAVRWALTPVVYAIKYPAALALCSGAIFFFAIRRRKRPGAP